MISRVILDTGPLVAFLHAPDFHHVWVSGIMKEIRPPLVTCEAVISEACFLLASSPVAVERISAVLRSGVIEVGFSLQEESSRVFALMKRYADLPMSFADSCLVAMSERYEESRVLTLDSAFEIYRRHRRRKIPVLAPWSEG